MDQLVAWGALYYSYSVLVVPIARDLGVSTSAVAAGFSISLLTSALVAPRVGQVMDRVGARPLLLYGAILGPSALVGLATVNRGWTTLAAMLAGLGLAQALSLYEPAFRAVVTWFPDARQRSRALLVLTVVAGFASTVFLPLTALLLSRLGWRRTAIALATTVALTTLPIRLALPRTPTRARSAAPATARVGRGAFAKMLSAGFAVQAFAGTGATLCLVWQLVERGETLEIAASLAGVVGAAQVPGRLLLSPLSKALLTEVRLPLLLFLQAAAVVGVATLSGPALIASLMTLGAAAGAMTLERAAIVIEWFGRESFGTGNGRLASSSLFARAAAPFSIELLRVHLDYVRVFLLLGLCFVVSGVLLALAARARRTALARSGRHNPGVSAISGSQACTPYSKILEVGR